MERGPGGDRPRSLGCTGACAAEHPHGGGDVIRILQHAASRDQPVTLQPFLPAHPPGVPRLPERALKRRGAGRILATMARPRPSPARLALLLALVALAGQPRAAQAQGLLPGLAGGGAGLVVGGSAAVGVVAARTHLAGDYLESWSDLTPGPAAVVAAGLVSGVVLGTTDAAALGRASVAALILGGAGVGIGALAGRRFLDPDTGPWAGALIGGGLGALTGWILGALLDADRADVPTSFAVSVPVGPGGGAP